MRYIFSQGIRLKSEPAIERVNKKGTKMEGTIKKKLLTALKAQSAPVCAAELIALAGVKASSIQSELKWLIKRGAVTAWQIGASPRKLYMISNPNVPLPEDQTKPVRGRPVGSSNAKGRRPITVVTLLMRRVASACPHSGTPEGELWLSVLESAFYHGVSSGDSMYVETNSFRWICRLLDMNPAWVRMQYLAAARWWLLTEASGAAWEGRTGANDDYDYTPAA